MDLVAQYKRLEEQFFRDLAPESVKELERFGFSVQDSFIYGEFGFMLVGIKPAVLIQFPLLQLTLQYKQKVIDPILDKAHQTAEWATIDLHYIKGALASPEMALTGSLVLYRKTHSLYATVHDTLLSDKEAISEDQLAEVLDYPGSLPKTESQVMAMYEVAYIDTSNQRLLTTFAALHHELDDVRTHFARYKATVWHKLGIEMQLIVRGPVG